MNEERPRVLSEEEKDRRVVSLDASRKRRKKRIVSVLTASVAALVVGGVAGGLITHFCFNTSFLQSAEDRLIYNELSSKWLYLDEHKNDLSQVFSSLRAWGNLSFYNDPYTAYGESASDLGITDTYSGVFGFSSRPSYAYLPSLGRNVGGNLIVDLYDGKYKEKGGEIGDLIYAFKKNDGEYINIEDITPDQATSGMKAENENDELSFKIITKDGKEKVITSKAGEAKVVPVKEIKKDGNKKLLVLNISTFIGNNPTAISSAVLDEVQSFIDTNNTIESLVFDCRDNGGGYTVDGATLSSLFLDANKQIYSVINNKGQVTESASTQGAPRFGKDKVKNISILLNGNSASCTELFSNAMKENGRAKVYGTNSYGKGVQQRIIKIKDLSKTYGVLKITTEKVLTPLGNCIQGVGITPDTYTDTSYYKYYNNLVRSPYMESSYRLTYLQEQSVLTSIKYLDGYSTCNTYSEAITKFQGEFKDSNGLTVNGNYDTRTLYALYGEMNKLYNQGYNQELEFVIDESLK